MDFKNLKFNIKQEDIVEKIRIFFAGKSRLILAAIFFIAIAYCAYLLYVNVHKSGWSEDKKREYIDSKGKEMVFDEKRFNSLVASEEERKNKHTKKLENIPDIFMLK